MDCQKTMHATRQESLPKRGTKKVVVSKAIHHKSPSLRRKVQLLTIRALRMQPGIPRGQLRPLLPMPVDVDAVIPPELDMNISHPSLGAPDLQQNVNHGKFDPLHHFPLAHISNVATSGQDAIYGTSRFSEPLMPEMGGVGYAFPSAALLPSLGNDVGIQTMMTRWNPANFIYKSGSHTAPYPLSRKLAIRSNPLSRHTTDKQT